MSESGVGASVAATRQNAGSLSIGFAPGGVKVPSGTSSAAVMVVCGSLSWARLSQVAAESRGRSARANSRTECRFMSGLDFEDGLDFNGDSGREGYEADSGTSVESIAAFSEYLV